jgi:transposase
MYLKCLELLARSEVRSRDYLGKKCWAGKRRFCVRCHSLKLYHLADRRYRCGQCRYTFQDFTGRWIGELNLKASDWLWILKLFELEIPARQTAHEVGVSYPTALKAAHTIRRAIAAHEFADGDRDHGETEAISIPGCDTGMRAGESRGGNAVFGLAERAGKAEATALRDLSVAELFRSEIKIVKRGALLCTDRFSDYDALVFAVRGKLPTADANHLADGKIYIDRLEGFWSFAKERLFKSHPAAKAMLPLYVKELQFRYNHRGTQLFELLVDRIVSLVPKF